MTMRRTRLRRRWTAARAAGLAALLGSAPARVRAQSPRRSRSACWCRCPASMRGPGTVMRMGAEMAIEDINAAGGIKALGGAKLELVVLDSGDTTEKAKNAAQRMVAQEPDLVAATGSYLSSFTLAVTEVTERAQLPMLTLSYSDLITERGFKYVFQTSATAGLAGRAVAAGADRSSPRPPGGKPEDGRHHHRQHRGLVSSVKPMRERLLKELGLELVVDETFTPPLADATPLVQKVRAARPDLLFFLPTVISDAKLDAREDERVRPRPGPHPDDLVRHRHRRARHAAAPWRPSCCRA